MGASGTGAIRDVDVRDVILRDRFVRDGFVRDGDVRGGTGSSGRGACVSPRDRKCATPPRDWDGGGQRALPGAWEQRAVPLLGMNGGEKKFATKKFC